MLHLQDLLTDKIQGKYLYFTMDSIQLITFCMYFKNHYFLAEREVVQQEITCSHLQMRKLSCIHISATLRMLYTSKFHIPCLLLLRTVKARFLQGCADTSDDHY